MLASVWGESFTFYLLLTAFKERPQRQVDDNPGGGIATRHEHPPINGGEEGTDCAQDDDDTDASDNKRRLRKRGRWLLRKKNHRCSILHTPTRLPVALWWDHFFFLQFSTVLFRFQKILVKNVTIEYLDMHDVLNVDKKKSIAQFTCKLRDQSFESNCTIIWQYNATVNIC